MAKEGFSFLVSADPELIKDRLQALTQPLGFTLRIFWGDEALDDQYWQMLSVPNMMGPPNAVVLRRAQEQGSEFWKTMTTHLARAKVSIWPIFCLEGPWKSGRSSLPKVITQSKFWIVAQKKGWVWEHPGLNRRNIGRELDAFAQEHGLTWGPGVKKVLVESLPLTVIALRHELEKILLLLSGEAVVTLEHLDAVQSEHEFDIFSFLRALQTPSGRKSTWEAVLNDPAMTSGDLLFPITALLVREARILWLLAHDEDARVNLYPSLKREKKTLAKKMGPKKIGQIWDFALQAHTDVKAGRVRPDQALERLVNHVQRLW